MTYNTPNDDPTRPDTEPTHIGLSPDADACGMLGCRRSEPLFFKDGCVVCVEHLDTDVDASEVVR
jgi:hypothetical protein